MRGKAIIGLFLIGLFLVSIFLNSVSFLGLSEDLGTVSGAVAASSGNARSGTGYDGIGSVPVSADRLCVEDSDDFSLLYEPDTQWNRTYGGTSNDYSTSVVQTGDGGYALAGSTGSYGSGNPDFWLVKTDSAGNVLWNKTYGGINTDAAVALIETGDGGYALAGYTYSYGAGSGDSWLVKTDSSGNAQWNKTYGGTNTDEAYALVQTSDGGYALAGETNSYGAGGWDFWLIKTDASGNAQWNKTYGGTNWDECYALIQTSDGGYALAGQTFSYGAGEYDCWLVKTDAGGNAQWNKTYGGPDHDHDTQSIVQTSDGGYVLAGRTLSYGAGAFDAWLVKTDLNGNMQWNKTYGGTGNEQVMSLVQSAEGGYAFAGNTYSYGAGGNDVWLVKTDSAGNKQWEKTYGGAGDDSASDVIITSDGGYALAGNTYSYGAGANDFWLVKIAPEPPASGVEWVQFYGGSNYEIARSIVEATGGGYVMTGYTSSFGAGSTDVWLVGTDFTGNMQWNKTYGGTEVDEARSVIRTSDGGYALAGSTNSFGAGGVDFYLVKTDSSGNMQWNRTYGGSGADWGWSIIQTTDGEYAVVGSTDSHGAGSDDFWLVKTDSNGNALWNKTYGGANADDPKALVQTSDGGYAIVGTTKSFGNGLQDFWLVRTDSNGTMLWNRTYGGTGNDDAYSMVQTTLGGYVLGGYTESFGAGFRDAWLIETDSSGNLLLNRTFGSTGDDRVLSLFRTLEGGYAFGGYTDAFGAGGTDFWLVKTNTSGNVQWNKTWGGTGEDYVQSLLQTGDGGYVMAGGIYSFGAGSCDFALVRVAPELPAPIVEWNRRYGGSSTELALALVQTDDGGYAMAGVTYESSPNEPDGWLVRTDRNGNMLWNKTYGGLDTDEFSSLVYLDDGGFAMAGRTRSYGESIRHPWLLRTDSNGNVVWNRTYGGSTPWDWAYSLIQTDDGGFAMGGSIGADGCLIKTDSSGNAQWNKTYGGIYSDGVYSIIQTPDDGYTLAGYERSYSGGWEDYWLIKTDSTGNMLWNQTYGWPGRDEAPGSLIRTADGGYLLSGETTSSHGAEDSDGWLVRTDSNGNMLWNRTYGSGREHTYSIVQTADGGYALYGYTSSFSSGGDDFWLVKIDEVGDVQWSNAYGGPYVDYVESIIQTSDGGYMAAGGTDSYGAGKWDFWLVKISPEWHDVAVTDVTSTQKVVEQGETMPINVTLENQGDYPDSFNVTVYCNSTAMETQVVNDLAEGSRSILTFTWETTGAIPGNYTISANASVVIYETDISDNSLTDGTVRIVLLSDLEKEVVALVNGSRAYDYDLDLENIAFDYPAFRSSGSTGGNETANWIKGQFEGFGLETWLEPFEFTTWNLSSTPSLIIDDDGNPSTTYDQTAIASFQCEHYSWPTAEDGAFSDLVILPLPEAANYGELGKNPIDTATWDAVDTTGKIVLIGREIRSDPTYTWEYIYQDKLRAQPPAAVILTWWYAWNSFAPSFFSSAGGRPLSYFGPYYWEKEIPVGDVSYEDGLWIRNRENTLNVSSRVSIRSVISSGTHYNVVGRIRGYTNPEKVVIISAHYDTVMSSGFCDNGAGTAGIIELAQVIEDAVEKGSYRPKYTLLFVAFAAEELGLVGSINYVKQHKSETANITAVMNLDCIGSDELYASETESADGFDLDGVILNSAQDLGVEVTLEPPAGSDQESFRNPSWANDVYYWYWGLTGGIADAAPVNSSATLISYPLIYRDKWSVGTPGWMHTSYDNSTSTATLNWVEIGDLENHLRVTALAIVRTSPTSPVEIVQTTVTVEGEDYTITTESNAAITSVSADRCALHFSASGLTGQTAFGNVTIPAGLNRTEIKVVIDDIELVPPPYPVIATNGTHYSVYFEFTLSSHNVTVQYAVADLAAIEVTSTKTVVGQGYATSINATIQNQGNYQENLTVTVYANTTSVASQNITIASGDSAIITLTWNTTGFAFGNYTLSVFAWPVPNEADTLDNTLVYGHIVVAIPGDVNGDSIVNILDSIVIGNSFLAKIGESRWNPNADINNDNVINVLDAIIVGNHFLQHYP